MTKLICTVLFATLAMIADASAQTYPSRQINMVVPYPAGGVTDVLARLIAKHMEATLGQTIIVENVSGAGGSIGTGRVARAAPDGYTIALGNSETNVLNGAALKLPYDVVKDFEAVVLLPSYPFIIVSTNSVPAKNLKELVAWIKSDPGKVSQGTVGTGTMQHLCGLALQKAIGARWQLIPYRGGAPAMQDLISGQFNIMCTASGSFLPLVRSGQIRAYAVTAPARMMGEPSIPTVDEAGLPGIHASIWNAIWVPKGAPKDAIAKLNAAAVKALDDPAFSKRVVEMGLDMPPRDQRTPEALATLQRIGIETWWPLMKAAGIEPR